MTDAHKPWEAYLTQSGLTPRKSADHAAFDCPEAVLQKVCKELKERWSFDLLVDLTAIDWGPEAQTRFSTVTHLLSSKHATYVRLVVPCADNAAPTMPTLSGIWPAADWHEREAYDMFGIVFTGHPNLKRILMWEGYPYFPLRKEFPLGGLETELPAADVVEATGTPVEQASILGGPFVSDPDSGKSMAQREPSAR